MVRRPAVEKKFTTRAVILEACTNKIEFRYYLTKTRSKTIMQFNLVQIAMTIDRFAGVGRSAAHDPPIWGQYSEKKPPPALNRSLISSKVNDKIPLKSFRNRNTDIR
jgi:hypothetical protein